MSYQIGKDTLTTFINQPKMKLPRFQRKSTWTPAQNFGLAISIFQDYPIGVVIINNEYDKKLKTDRPVLLDGRQRWTAIKEMRSNPINLYDWAKKTISFKSTSDYQDIIDKFWKYVEEFLNPKEDEEDVEKETEYENSMQLNENPPIYSFSAGEQYESLNVLLELILMIHKDSWKKMFTSFKKYFDNLRYLEDNEFHPDVLREYILNIIAKYNEEEVDYADSMDIFIAYFKSDRPTTTEKLKDFKTYLGQHWNEISKWMKYIDKSEEIFKHSEIAKIELTNATPLDAQNIFIRVNKGGSPLAPEELLSAKPYWNEESKNVSSELGSKIEKIYKNFSFGKPDKFVKWDLAATFISRLKPEYNFIFSNYEFQDKKLDNTESKIAFKHIQLSFKLLSSLYVGGMSNKHICDLEKNTNWDSEIDNTARYLNEILNILTNDCFFSNFMSWNIPLINLIGNCPTFEFITILYKFWTKNNPSPEKLVRKAKLLFDKLFYEYLSGQWKGSGDSRMALHLKDNNWTERLENAQSEQDWSTFIDNACEGVLNGKNISYGQLKPFLIYYYLLKDIYPITSEGQDFDVDHIYSQDLFKENAMLKDINCDSLYNLTMLPKTDNIKKSKKKLDDLKSQTYMKLRKNIKKYTEFTDDTDFDTFSNVSELEELKARRKKLFKETFAGNTRINFLGN